MTSLDWAKRYDFAQAALLAANETANGAVFPIWIDETRFWYERKGEEGGELRVVDAAAGETRAVVKRARIAQALAAHLGAPVDPEILILQDLQFDPDRRVIRFSAYGDAYEYAYETAELSPAKKRSDPAWIPSPDGKWAAILREDNLWLRDLARGEERPLTTDGTETYAYGDVPYCFRDLRGRIGDAVPEAIWSPDSRWLLTHQTDDRQVPDLPVLEFAPATGVRPNVRPNKVSLPGDPKVTEFRMLAIEVATGRQVEARFPRLSAVRMNKSPIGTGLAWWGADSRKAYFVDIERGEQAAHVVVFDIETGAAQVVFTETSSTYVEVAVSVYGPALIWPLPETDELLWYSERSGRGHLYLYDLATGSLKGAVTAGEWQVRDLFHVDSNRREVYLLAAGIAPNENPYVCKPCLASLDGGTVKILSDKAGDHRLWRAGDMSLSMKRLEGLDPARVSALSPGGDYFVETVGSVDGLPVTYLRDREGKEIALLEQATADLPIGWQWPEAVRCAAADGVTDTYGLLFRPLGYDPKRRYPIIDLIYGGPQVAHVPHGSFADGNLLRTQSFLEAMHLSALGAFVLILDGRGSGEREKAFRTASYRAVHTASNIEDHIAAIRQLSETRPQIDVGRVGITGFSGGGYMTVHAALRFGDFFKVAVAGGGNYDQALFWHTWGERYHGAFDEEHYAVQAARTYAEGMSGKLMLVHGLMDEGCHPAGLFQLVQDLIDANKDPDLVLLPRAYHEWTGYGMRRRWDYFITQLLGSVPPQREPFTTFFDVIRKRAEANAVPPRSTR